MVEVDLNELNFCLESDYLEYIHYVCERERDKVVKGLGLAHSH